MSTDALNESVTGAVSLGSAASEHKSPEGEGVASGNNPNSGGPTDSSMSRKKSSVTSTTFKTAAGRSLSTAKVHIYTFNWCAISSSHTATHLPLGDFLVIITSN